MTHTILIARTILGLTFIAAGHVLGFVMGLFCMVLVALGLCIAPNWQDLRRQP